MRFAAESTGEVFGGRRELPFWGGRKGSCSVQILLRYKCYNVFVFFGLWSVESCGVWNHGYQVLITLRRPVLSFWESLPPFDPQVRPGHRRSTAFHGRTDKGTDTRTPFADRLCSSYGPPGPASRRHGMLGWDSAHLV